MTYKSSTTIQSLSRPSWQQGLIDILISQIIRMLREGESAYKNQHIHIRLTDILTVKCQSRAG